MVFSTWDLAGQEVYYATHQCFLSRNTLYLVVWNMEEGEKGVRFLTPWLLNIQVREGQRKVGTDGRMDRGRKDSMAGYIHVYVQYTMYIYVYVYTVQYTHVRGLYRAMSV